MATLAKEVAPILGEPDHPVSAALLSLLALDAALRFAGDEAVDLALRACVVARRHDDWLRTGPWLALLLSSMIAGRNDTVMITAREALTRAIADNDAFAVAEWHAQLGIANWMTGDVEEAQRLTEIGLMLAEKIGADNLIMRNAFLRGVSLLTPGSDPAVALQHFQRAVRLGERVGGNALYGGAAWAILLSNCGADNMSAAELAHELAANLPTPMFLADADGTLVFYNDAAGVHLRQDIRRGRTDPVDEWTTVFTPREQGLRSRRTSSRWRSRCNSGARTPQHVGTRSLTVCAVNSRSQPSHFKGNGASTSARRRSSGKRSERHGSRNSSPTMTRRKLRASRPDPSAGLDSPVNSSWSPELTPKCRSGTLLRRGDKGAPLVRDGRSRGSSDGGGELGEEVAGEAVVKSPRDRVLGRSPWCET